MGKVSVRDQAFFSKGQTRTQREAFFQVRISPYCIAVAFFNTSFRISCHLRLNFIRVWRHISPNLLCCVHLWVLSRCGVYWLHMQTTTAIYSEAFSANINAFSQPVHGWCCMQCPGKNGLQQTIAVFSRGCLRSIKLAPAEVQMFRHSFWSCTHYQTGEQLLSNLH